SRELAEETVVEASYPGLGRTHDVASVAAGTGHDLQIGNNIDDADARNEVALHRAGELDDKPAAHEVDQKRDLSVPLRAAEAKAVPADQLRRNREPAFDLRMCKHCAGDVADPGNRARLKPDRHAHRPGRQAAPA